MKKIWHHWELWECYRAGFYHSCADIGINKEMAQKKYMVFLSDLNKFEDSLRRVIAEWEYSCEHFLTDVSRNRVAWLGQASMAFSMGVPSEARGGYRLMTKQQQKKADAMALKYLKIWEHDHKNKNISKQMEFTWVFKRHTG